MHAVPRSLVAAPATQHFSFFRVFALALLAAPACAAFAGTGTGAVDISASVSPDPVVVGKPATFSVAITAHPPATVTPTGRVDITNGANAVCSVTLPAGSCRGQISATGTQAITVLYNGDANYALNGITKNISVVPTTNTALNSTPNPSATGQAVTLNATALGGTNPGGTMTFKDGTSNLCTNIAMKNSRASCTTNALSAGSHSLTAVYSGDANNGGSTSAVVTQVVQGSVLDLDQFGLTGTWFNSATSGQGFLMASYPDLMGPGTGLIAGSWFTYDVAPAGGADKQRWYTFSGNAPTGAASANVTIYTSIGGNFNAPPQIPVTNVGSGTLKFDDCGSGSFAYNFTDGRTGNVPITRLTPNVTCGTNGDNGTAPGLFQLSGAWFDPNTSGQGLLFEVNPVQNYFAGAWYTFAPNGQAIGGVASERWYTLQGPITPGSKVITNIDVSTSVGGVFDNGTTPTQSQVGKATLSFLNCTTATLTFNFTGGSSGGTSGTINLQRLGPAPSGCNL